MADDAGGPDRRAGVAQPGGGEAAAAVTDLFRDHHLELVRLALVMVGDLATAEDVVRTPSSGCTAAGVACASRPAAWRTCGPAS